MSESALNVAREHPAGKTGERVLESAKRGRALGSRLLHARAAPVVAVVGTAALMVTPRMRERSLTAGEVALLAGGVFVLLTAFVRVRQRLGGDPSMTRHYTWLPTLLLGAASGAVNLPYAPLPVADEGVARSTRVTSLALLGGTTTVLLVLGRLSLVPATEALAAALLVMTSSALTPVKPCDGGFLGSGRIVTMATLATFAGGVLLLLGVL